MQISRLKPTILRQPEMEGKERNDEKENKRAREKEIKKKKGE